MDFTPGIELTRKHWRLIVIVAVLASSIAFGASYLFTPSYAATTQILVRAREARFLTSTGQDLSRQPGVVDSNLAKALAQTNAGLVSSRLMSARWTGERSAFTQSVPGTRTSSTNVVRPVTCSTPS